MRKAQSLWIIFIVLQVLFPTAPSKAQTTETELIDNFGITAIKRMEVTEEKEGTFLNLTVYLENKNDRIVRFDNGTFIFYLRTHKDAPAPVTEAELLGMDNRPRKILLYSTADLREQGKPDFNSIDFKVDLGNEQAQILRSLKRIVNAMGDPPVTRPIFLIDGKFHLGLKSGKGWSLIPTRINWAFKPNFLEEAVLTAAKDTPISFPQTQQEIVDRLGKLEPPPTPSEDASDSGPLDNFPYEAAPKIGALINFDYDSDDIRRESYPLLDEYGKALNNEKLSKMILIIAGHASSEGSDAYNLDLSERRAASVKEYLVNNHGIHPKRLISTGYGESKPLISNTTSDGRELNRRVEFIPYQWAQ